MSILPVIRSHPVSVPAVVVALCGIASIVSPWSISIPPAHLAESFGFQTPAGWITVLALLAAVLLEMRAAVISVGIATGVLIAWFAWAMWVVTTPRFAQLPFPFIGTDLIGPGWYAAAIGLLVAAGVATKELLDRDAPIGADLWILTAIPGFGLARLGIWARGLTWTALFSAALYFASIDSPDPWQFAEFGRSGNVPPAYPREPEWVLLGLAAVLWVLSIAATAWERRRRLQLKLL